METKKVDLAHLTNDKHYQFGEEFSDHVEETDAKELKVETQFWEFTNCLSIEDEALKKITKSAYTEQIGDADKRRNHAFRGMADINRAMTMHFNLDKESAAKKLQVVFDTYGNITGKALTEKTGAYDNFLQEISSERYAEFVKLLGIDDWRLELDAANGEVRQLMKRRDDESAAKTDVVLREARARTDAAYRAIIKRIDALMEVEASDIYRQFIRKMNAIIERYNK